MLHKINLQYTNEAVIPYKIKRSKKQRADPPCLLLLKVPKKTCQLFIKRG